jgi:hypothetical protein
MRKLMVLSAMLAMMLLLSAAPAFAQPQIGGDQGPLAGHDAVQVGDNFQFAAVSQNIIGSFEAGAFQFGAAGAAAFGGDNAAATAEVEQSQNISVTQTNRTLNVVVH